MDNCILGRHPLKDLAREQEVRFREEGFIPMSEAHKLTRISYRVLGRLDGVEVRPGVGKRWVHVEQLAARIHRDSPERAEEFLTAVRGSGEVTYPVSFALRDRLFPTP